MQHPFDFLNFSNWWPGSCRQCRRRGGKKGARGETATAVGAHGEDGRHLRVQHMQRGDHHGKKTLQTSFCSQFKNGLFLFRLPA